MNATTEAVRLTAIALRQLFGDYPTDPDESTGAIVLTITATASGEHHLVELQPGQADWIRRLAEAEASTCRRAHPDEDGLCGHCGGTGKASANPTALAT